MILLQLYEDLRVLISQVEVSKEWHNLIQIERKVRILEGLEYLNKPICCVPGRVMLGA